MAGDSPFEPTDAGRPSAAAPDRRDSRRLRFSIFTILIAVACCAIWIANSSLTREKVRLESQLRRIAETFDGLIVIHPDRLAAVQRQPFRDERIWDVYIPPGHEFDLRLATEQIHDEGLPPNFETVSLPPGRHEIELRRADPPGRTELQILVDGRTVISISEDANWAAKQATTHEELQPKSLEHPIAQPLTLLRQTFSPRTRPRTHRPKFGYDPSAAGPADGILLWIQPR